jgi:hypothetical protein
MVFGMIRTLLSNDVRLDKFVAAANLDHQMPQSGCTLIGHLQCGEWPHVLEPTIRAACYCKRCFSLPSESDAKSMSLNIIWENFAVQ